jgi:hypothetical protein
MYATERMVVRAFDSRCGSTMPNCSYNGGEWAIESISFAVSHMRRSG